MNRFDLLKQTNIKLAARVIMELGERFHNNPEALVEHLEGKIKMTSKIILGVS